MYYNYKDNFLRDFSFSVHFVFFFRVYFWSTRIIESFSDFLRISLFSLRNLCFFRVDDMSRCSYTNETTNICFFCFFGGGETSPLFIRKKNVSIIIIITDFSVFAYGKSKDCNLSVQTFQPPTKYLESIQI